MKHTRKDTDELIRDTIAEIRNTTAAHIYLGLKHNGKRITQQEIADIIGTSRQRLHQVIASLECKKTD